MSLRKIADYTIIREQGRGGMGAVFQALSPEGATVALKTVVWPEGADPKRRWEVIERFQREARAAQSLTHPNICQVLDCGADGDSLYIVMEFLDGSTVRHLLNQAGVIHVTRAASIMRGVGAALAHAHERGIVHRDVKPENVMILRTGEVKLTDFGLASIQAEQGLTSTGRTMGTLFYMSPEQVRGEKVDARSDIFSLGAMCYEMLTGVRPFRGEDSPTVMNLILASDPAPVSGVPPTVSATVETCLRKRPEDRFQTAAEMLRALGPIGLEGVGADTPVLGQVAAAPVVPRPRRWPRVLPALRRWRTRAHPNNTRR